LGVAGLAFGGWGLALLVFGAALEWSAVSGAVVASVGVIATVLGAQAARKPAAAAHPARLDAAR